MSVSIAEYLDILLAAAWRRRLLILYPIVLFSVLSVLAILFWPRTYSAHTLLMLQERQAADPLSAGSGATREGRLKADEIDTLLKSDRVLSSAILDIHLGKKLLTPRDLENEVKSLRRQIGVGVVGGEFIEIEMKQSEREGLGERLSIILTRFFERLLTREDSMKTARQFALEQRKRDLDQTKKALEDWVDRYYASKGSVVMEGADKRVADLQAKQTAAKDTLFASANQVLPGPLDDTNIAQILASEQRLQSVRLQSGLGTAPTSPQRTMLLKDLENQLEGYQALSTDLSKAQLERAQLISEKLKDLPPGQADTYKEWQSLDARFKEAMAQYDAHQQRAKKATGPSATPFGLIAPESIRIIDEPRDPVSPTTSLLKIVLACIGAGIGMGVGLAALAEQLDDRVYDARDLTAMEGVETVIRLPRLDSDSTAMEAEPGSVSRRRPHLAVVSEA